MSDKKLNPRKSMMAMVAIALVLSKFAPVYGQPQDYPIEEQREKIQAIGNAAPNHWPDWRGPTGDGRSDATNLPLNWSEEENIVWETHIHDLGHSTTVCIDLNSGEVVYVVEVFIQTSLSEFIHRIPMRRLRPWWKKGVPTSTLAPLVQPVSIRKQVRCCGSGPI